MSKDMIKAAELRAVTGSQGWRVVNEIIDAIVREAETAALDCEDENKVVALQRDARVARKMFNEFKRRIGASTTVTEDDFSPISY